MSAPPPALAPLLALLGRELERPLQALRATAQPDPAANASASDSTAGSEPLAAVARLADELRTWTRATLEQLAQAADSALPTDPAADPHPSG